MWNGKGSYWKSDEIKWILIKGVLLLHLHNDLSSYVEAFYACYCNWTVYGTRILCTIQSRCLTQWAIPCNCVCNNHKLLCEWNSILRHMAYFHCGIRIPVPIRTEKQMATLYYVELFTFHGCQIKIPILTDQYRNEIRIQRCECKLNVNKLLVDNTI